MIRYRRGRRFEYRTILNFFSGFSLVKIYLEFRRNTTGIPAWTCPEFRVGSRWIPGEIHWNVLELLLAFPWCSAGIPDKLNQNSSGMPDWNSAGTIAGIPQVFQRNAGSEFGRNYCWYFLRILGSFQWDTFLRPGRGQSANMA